MWITGNPRDPVPDAPVNVNARSLGQTATITWSAPAFDGGDGVGTYVVTASPGGAQAVVSGSQTTATISGLVYGSTYTFTVVAINSAGNSLASGASTAITVGTPPAPGSPTAAAGSAEQAVLTWTVPADNGSAIASYTVTPYDGTTAGAPIVLLGAALTGTTVTGLTSGHAYSFTVYATNGNGAGAIATTNTVTVS